MHCLVILCILFSFTGSAAHEPDRISVNCGGAAALGGRKWGGDAAHSGSSTTSTVKGHLITAVDPVPYSTARISRSQFSYSFRLTPGQKFIRLHFNPAPYNGFDSFHDLFTVEAGPFTLLANFSASITARALSLAILAREFCIIVQENQPLNIVFAPETRHNYAFINGIEIVSVPSTISYCHGGDSGVDVLGQKSVIYLDSDTALERVYHQNMKWGSVSFGDDMFGIWESILKGNGNKASNLSWTVSVDVGFRYLVRVHLFEVGLKMDFMLMIDNIVALTSADMLKQSENQSILWYNYMVMVQGKKREGKRSISISLHSQNELVDRQGPLEGFEIFKLSNHHLSLATPNPPPPPPPPRGLSSIPTLLCSLLGRKNAIAAVLFTNMFLVNIIVHLLHTMWGTDTPKEENELSAMAKRHCHCFSLAEIQSATENFHSKNFIGQGGFGQVHRGFMDNGREIVAVKRLKQDSHQGGQQFWTEVKMLSELRHVNLVPLLGFCEEQHEMILVYEYMSCGTLADHLFKLAHKSRDYIPLSWKQRLKICIGAGRAIDYLHTGHGIIHRDVKSSNILLDEKLVAKVSDFGLAKTGFGSESQSQHSTQVRGTHGYMDPCYRETHKPTKNSDTYSFGVVLLEVLCGRRALERYVEDDKCHLPTWALENISKGQVDHIVYPSLAGEISPDSLKTFVSVAERCLHDEPKKRPAMTDVVVKLLLALQQQEKADSLDTNERTSIENLLSSADNYRHKEIMNEKISIVDALPQMENVAPNEIRNDRAILSSSLRPMASPSNRKTVRFLPSEQIKSSMINYGRKGGRKSMMLRISQKLWPWDAFWKTRKPSNKTDLVGTSISAPISRRTNSATMDGDTKRTAGMTSTTAMGPSNEREKYSQTMRVMRNISKGQDDIETQTLRGELSTDSLRTFDSTAERWLHDEPENLALERQEIAESSPPKDRSVEGGASSQEATTKLFGPNEKINFADDASPTPAELVSSSSGTSSQEANIELFGANKKINVADDASPSPVPPSADTSQKENVEHVGVNEKINVSNDASPSEFPQPNLRVFSLAELRAATRKFRSDSLLGEGGFGKVYKGWLDDRATGKTITIAVKKLHSESLQGLKEWQSEVNFLGKLSHPNLVKLLGYGREDNELLLVYEFMAKGSLENHLFGRVASVLPLPWDIMLNILIGAARGMAFLHGSKNTVIYRDFKASNILLDGSYQAKLSDFGLAKMGPRDGCSHVSTQVMGTYGYAAPEYVATGHLYVKSDVYGFGVVLVEMLTGLRAVDINRLPGQQSLADWIKPHLSDKRKLKRVIDVRLQGQCPTKSARHIAQLALTCLEPHPKNRPSMQEIVHTLEVITSSHERRRASPSHPETGLGSAQKT